MSEDIILEKWYKTKQRISELEKKIAKYRSMIERELNRKQIETIKTSNFSITRRRNTKTYVSKEHLPADIWQKYSVKSHYDSFHLVKL
jgi:hypothetical protein